MSGLMIVFLCLFGFILIMFLLVFISLVVWARYAKMNPRITAFYYNDDGTIADKRRIKVLIDKPIQWSVPHPDPLRIYYYVYDNWIGLFKERREAYIKDFCYQKFEDGKMVINFNLKGYDKRFALQHSILHDKINELAKNNAYNQFKWENSQYNEREWKDQEIKDVKELMNVNALIAKLGKKR